MPHSLFCDDNCVFAPATMYEGFVGILNKARSANVGVTFSHQSLGDLEKISHSFENQVLSNTNMKLVMRTNEPETCDRFAKMFGTVDSKKTTERQTRSMVGAHATGEGSVREVKEYKIHPDTIKSLPKGQAILMMPHSMGTVVKKVSLSPLKPLPVTELPVIYKPESEDADSSGPPSLQGL